MLTWLDDARERQEAYEFVQWFDMVHKDEFRRYRK